MKSKRLLDLLENIDDDLIEAAAPDKINHSVRPKHNDLFYQEQQLLSFLLYFWDYLF